jgi:hypothetical protein
MRRIDFSRRLEEASCGSRNGLLNRGSQVRILSPAPNPNSDAFVPTTPPSSPNDIAGAK